MYSTNLKFITILLIFSFNSKLYSIDIDSIDKSKEIWTDHTAQLYHDFYLMEAFRPINQALCQANNSDYENWINLNTLADPITKEMPTNYDPDDSSEDIFNLGYKANINDRNCGLFEDNFFHVIKASQLNDDSSLKIDSYKVRKPLSDRRWSLEISEDVSENNPYGILKYDLNIYGLARNSGLYLAHAESKYDQTGNNIIIDSITWVDAVIINQNLPAGQISETYRARINHNIGGTGFGTIIGMQQGGFDAQVTVPIPHGTFPDGIPDRISSTNFAYNDNFLLFETSRSDYPGSPWVQSEPQSTGLSCLDREIFWTYVPAFGYGVYDSNGDRLPDSANISLTINGTVATVSGTNIMTQFVCKNMKDGSVASDSDCINPSGNSYQYIPIIDVPDGTIITDSEGNQYYVRVLKPRKVYAYNDLTMCEDLSIQNPVPTPDHKTFVYLNDIDIPPSGAIIYNQYNSGDSSDQLYLGRVYIANEDDDGDRVLNFLDAFPDDSTKSIDDDYDEIDDLEDTEIVQTEMVWNKYLDKDIFELPDD